MSFALEKDVHDERLWMPIARATGALGNTSCLVSTAEQVAQAILQYYRLGERSLLIGGFDSFSDVVEFGSNLILLIKAGAVEIDRLQLPGNRWRPRMSVVEASPSRSQLIWTRYAV